MKSKKKLPKKRNFDMFLIFVKQFRIKVTPYSGGIVTQFVNRVV